MKRVTSCLVLSAALAFTCLGAQALLAWQNPGRNQTPNGPGASRQSSNSQEGDDVNDDGLSKATFGGGCFWCTEAVFQRLKGVESVVSGYAGGRVPNPTYQQVLTGRTGHAESIQITYDPDAISYEDLLLIFFATHDPTTRNRQGADVGPQYRSVIFYHDRQQQEVAQEMKKRLNDSGEFRRPIVTEITEFTNFYRAEDYHQNYFNRNPNNPYCLFNIPPKLEKLRQKFGTMMKSGE
jgi:peptide-methionine (S)-S-oxide reductase